MFKEHAICLVILVAQYLLLSVSERKMWLHKVNYLYFCNSYSLAVHFLNLQKIKNLKQGENDHIRTGVIITMKG